MMIQIDLPLSFGIGIGTAWWASRDMGWRPTAFQALAGVLVTCLTVCPVTAWLLAACPQWEVMGLFPVRPWAHGLLVAAMPVLTLAGLVAGWAMCCTPRGRSRARWLCAGIVTFWIVLLAYWVEVSHG